MAMITILRVVNSFSLLLSSCRLCTRPEYITLEKSLRATGAARKLIVGTLCQGVNVASPYLASRKS